MRTREHENTKIRENENTRIRENEEVEFEKYKMPCIDTYDQINP